jgi:hypothetical protein
MLARSFPFLDVSRSALLKRRGTVHVPAHGEPAVVWNRRGSEGCVLEFRLWVDMGDCQGRGAGADAAGAGEECRPSGRAGRCEGGGCTDAGNGDGLAGMMVRVRFDEASSAQIDVPVHALFLWNKESLSLAEHEMASLVVGHSRNASGWHGYFYLPMPFSSDIHVSLRWAPDEAADKSARAAEARQSGAEAEEGGSSAGWNVSYSLLWSPRRSCDLAEGGSGKGDEEDGEADVGLLHVVHREPTPVERHKDYALFDISPGRQGGGGGRGLLVGLVSQIEAAGMCVCVCVCVCVYVLLLLAGLVSHI